MAVSFSAILSTPSTLSFMESIAACVVWNGNQGGLPPLRILLTEASEQLPFW